MKIKILFLFLIVTAVAASTWYIGANDLIGKWFNEDQPDVNAQAKSRIGMEQYLILRNEHLDMLRGFDTARQDSRETAIREMETGERELADQRRAANRPEAVSWVPLGPAPIPVNASTSYSGRVSAIAVHPTNPNIVYAGTASGGLYRSLNGGVTWVPLLDGALTLAVGAVAISPSDPTTVFVGTGEATLCGTGCFIGVGLYRITNAETSPVVSGPLNRNAAGADVFSGRAVSEIIVHPTNPNILFTSTTSGVAGIGGTTVGFTVPQAGVYRTTNALAADPVFERLTIQGTLSTSRSVTDIAIEPDNPNRLVAGVIGSGGDGGVYLTTNALDATPAFTRSFANGDGSQLGRTEFAVNKAGGVVTVYAATGTATGTLHKSIDGGATFPTLFSNGFCNPQCFYDIAVAVDPADANRVYLGGSPALVFGRSTNGGTNFAGSSSGLHVDTQAFGLSPSNPDIMYFGSDGGIWRTNNVKTAGAIAWTTLNNTTFSATQFMGLALHPLDRNYMIGGTQDNGTQFLAANGTTWVRSDGGDGGFAVIDKTSPSTLSVTAYHTYFNQTNSQIGFSRATTTEPNGDPNWSTFFGCGGTANGINCADAVLFYAPMVGGPNAPGSMGNTLYFGTNRLYRSINRGTTMTDVSGTLPARISAIAISPQNDDIRLVGTTAGSVYLSTTAGAATMTNVTGSIAARYVGRLAIDPNDANIAYVALNGFGLAGGQHVWKTTNLLSGAPVWNISGVGIPDTPVSTLAIDPANAQNLYAGTDIGVFRSRDGGATWTPFSTGLPRLAVFGMEIQPIHRLLKIATHGRGVWEYDLAAPDTATPFDFDGDRKADISVFRPSNASWYIQRSSSGFFGFQFGISTDRITPADYDGDGKTDLAVYRPAEGNWYILNSSDGTFRPVNFGLAADLPAPGDFDGDGKADISVFRPSDGTWYRLNSTNGAFVAFQFGTNGDVPTIGDFDGDGKSDIAVFRPSASSWFRINSSNGAFYGEQFGAPGDLIAPADYDGDAKSDIAVYRPSQGTWYIRNAVNASFATVQFGASGDIPTPGDYDGDGKADVSVFRPSDTNWYRLNSINGSFFAFQFGATGDRPAPAAYIPVP